MVRVTISSDMEYQDQEIEKEELPNKSEKVEKKVEEKLEEKAEKIEKKLKEKLEENIVEKKEVKTKDINSDTTVEILDQLGKIYIKNR